MPRRVVDENGYGAGQSYITVYTEAEIKQAVDKEREACALICDSMGEDYTSKFDTAFDLAKAIRARGES